MGTALPVGVARSDRIDEAGAGLDGNGDIDADLGQPGAQAVAAAARVVAAIDHV